MRPLVFLSGMMCDARLFEPQINALSEQYDVQVVPITEFETITELAAEVLLKTPATFALAGLSMGGIVAMEIMAEAPIALHAPALLP